MPELHTRLLDLAAQRNGAFRFRQPPTAQDVVALVEQGAHPGSAIGTVTVANMAADGALKMTFPRAQPISTLDIGIRQSLPQQIDKLVQPRLTQIRRGRRADPLHMPVPRCAFGQQRPIGGQHLAPVAVRVDLRHHPDDEIGVVGRQIDERTVGFGQRGDCGHGEHHRGRSLRRAQFVGLDVRVLGQPLPQRVDHAGGPRQPRAGHQHDVAAVHARRAQAGVDRRHHGVGLSDRIRALATPSPACSPWSPAPSEQA